MPDTLRNVRMARWSLLLATVALALALLLRAGPAEANLPASIDTVVSPGGNTKVTSPTLPPTLKSVHVDVVPAKGEDEQLFQNMQMVLASDPSPKSRLVTCVGFYVSVVNPAPDEVDVSFDEPPQALAVLLLAACLQMAADINKATEKAVGRTASAAATQCHRMANQVSARYTKKGKRYGLKVKGTIIKQKGRSLLKVACKPKGKGMTLTVRPAKKGKTLRSVVGPALAVGAYNPLEATGSAKLKFTFRR